MDLRKVARAGQKARNLPLYGALLGEREDLARRVLTVLYDKKTKQPVAFNALCYLDVRIGERSEPVVHLGLVFIDPAFQSKHLSNVLYGESTFLLFFKSGMRSFWISNVTQVPAVVGLTARHYDDVYPHPDPRVRQTFAHLALARAIMRDFRDAFGVGSDAGFDEARQIITNAYTGGSDELKKTFEEAPKHRDPRVNEMCRAWLDYERGDDFLQIGRCGIRTILRFLGQKAPGHMLGQLLFRALSLLVLGLVVPVVRWLVIPEDPRLLGEGAEGSA